MHPKVVLHYKKKHSENKHKLRKLNWECFLSAYTISQEPMICVSIIHEL